MLKKKILLIGGYGFLGSNILKWIDENTKDVGVTVISSIRTLANHLKFSCVEEELFGDFGDCLFLQNAFVNCEYDYIFHCLTSTTPVNSNSSIIKDIESNLINTVNLLEIIKKHKSILVFFSSGGAIYGNSNSIIHTVKDIPNPVSSYGIVKNTIEQYIKLFNKLYGIKYLNLRISNPYGYFHKSKVQGFVNVAIRRLLKNEPIEIWGDGNNVKDYIFASDIPPIVFSLLEKNCINRTINIGSGQGTSLNNILDLLKKINPKIQISYKESKLHDVKDFILDIDSIRESINLTPLNVGLIKTYDWQKSEFKNQQR